MPRVKSCLHCQFLSHGLKALIFNQNSPKMKLLLQKMQNFRALGALHPNPQSPAAGGSAPAPQIAPHYEFLAMRLNTVKPRLSNIVLSKRLFENYFVLHPKQFYPLELM